MYESMEERVENVVKSGNISHSYITKEEEAEALSRWSTDEFTPQNHPPLVQVLISFFFELLISQLDILTSFYTYGKFFQNNVYAL